MPDDDVNSTHAQPQPDAPPDDPGRAGAPPAPPAPPAPGDDPAARIGALERDLQRARTEVEALTRRARVEHALHRAGAADIHAAAAQVQGALGSAPADEARVAQEVARLKARRPGLFGEAGAPWRAVTPSAMGGAPAPPPQPESPGALAARARAGDRASLIAYLRARRAR